MTGSNNIPQKCRQTTPGNRRRRWRTRSGDDKNQHFPTGAPNWIEPANRETEAGQWLATTDSTVGRNNRANSEHGHHGHLVRRLKRNVVSQTNLHRRSSGTSSVEFSSLRATRVGAGAYSVLPKTGEPEGSGDTRMPRTNNPRLLFSSPR